MTYYTSFTHIIADGVILKRFLYKKKYPTFYDIQKKCVKLCVYTKRLGLTFSLDKKFDQCFVYNNKMSDQFFLYFFFYKKTAVEKTPSAPLMGSFSDGCINKISLAFYVQKFGNHSQKKCTNICVDKKISVLLFV